MNWDIVIAATIGAAAPTLAWLRGRAQDRESAKVKITENRHHDARIVIEGLGDIIDDLRAELDRIRKQNSEDSKALRGDCEAKIDKLKERISELEKEVERLNQKIIKML